MSLEHHDATFIGANHSSMDPGLGLTKQERDVVFAAQVVQAGFVSERELKKAVSTWTIHGEDSLATHLIRVGVIDETQKRQVEELVNHVIADSNIMEIKRAQTGTKSGSTGSSVIENLDGSGKMGRLLGYSADTISHDDKDQRIVSGRYLLVKKLGQGGLGTVWLARDEMLKRYVAIKEIRKGVVQQTAAVRRFQREAELTGRLEHPSIVPIYQFGTDERQDHHFYVMRFLGKQTLHDAILEYHERLEAGEDTTLLLHSLLNAFTNVCQAIAYAHSRKVIHRDLKPENVALDHYGQVIVLDWGLAKLIGDEGMIEGAQVIAENDEGHQGTMAGQILGSPMFMAPEQAAGRNEEIDERTDIYGLGAILYTILTGVPPHQSRSNSSQGSGSNIASVLSSIVSQPSPRVHDLRPDLPPGLDAICARAMAKRRYGRYQSASELAEDVQRYTAGEPVSAYEENIWQKAQRWIATHRRLSQVAAVLLTVFLVVAVNSVIAARRDWLAEKQTHFETIRGHAYQLSDNIKSPTLTLMRNTRFMASIPPVQGIINAKFLREGESEEVWQARIEKIYNGILAANPEYVDIWFLYYDQVTGSIEELHRQERSQNDLGSIRTLPASRLRSLPVNESLKSLFDLKPGDVLITRENLFSNLQETKEELEVAPNQLSAAIPVFDEVKGELFGAVGIDLNLEAIFTSHVKQIITGRESVLIVDPRGEILLAARSNGEPIEAWVGQPISKILPLASEFVTPQGLQEQVSDDETFFARRLTLGGSRLGTTIGIVILIE